MFKIHFFLAIILCTYMNTLSAADQTLYTYTLKNGQKITGYGEELGIDRLKIHIVFKGKVMASKEVPLTDIISRKRLESAVTPEKNTEKQENTQSEQANKREGDVEKRYHKMLAIRNESKTDFHSQLAKFAKEYSNFNFMPEKKIFEEQLLLTQQKLDAYIEAQQSLYLIKIDAITAGTITAKQNLEKMYAQKLSILKNEIQDEVNATANNYTLYLYAQKWVKSANLRKLNENDFDQHSLIHVKAINQELSDFESMRKNKSAYDYNKIIRFLKNDTFITLYGKTRQ